MGHGTFSSQGSSSSSDNPAGNANLWRIAGGSGGGSINIFYRDEYNMSSFSYYITQKVRSKPEEKEMEEMQVVVLLKF